MNDKFPTDFQEKEDWIPRDPAERPGEKIGGGFLIFRRGKKTGRVGARYNTLPFEHPDRISAEKEVARLMEKFPGEIFTIWQEHKNNP